MSKWPVTMSSTPSKYVFREDAHGKLEFVGDFEGLYRAQVDPWGQAAEFGSAMTAYYNFSRSQLIGTVNRRINSVDRNLFVRGLEVGCGHGYVVDILTNFTRLEWHGTDISAIAVAQAQQRFPRYRLFVSDITKPNAFATHEAQYNIVVLGQILWYVFHEMTNVIDNCYEALDEFGLLVISQAFLVEQRYGRDIANGFAGTLDLLSKYSDKFELIDARYEDALGLVHNDGIFVLRKV